MAGIVEIRDYTIEAEWFDRYKVWAETAVPWLKAHLDVIDFWIDDGIEADLTGSDPRISPHGQPNVCWIIRWASKEERIESSRPCRRILSGRRSGPSTLTRMPIW